MKNMMKLIENIVGESIVALHLAQMTTMMIHARLSHLAIAKRNDATVFAAFEKAWAEGDPESLVVILDPEEKVSLSFTEGGPRGGYFNRDQAFFLLKDMLEFTRTDRFEFQKFWNLESEGRSPYAVAVREFRMNDEDTHEDQVYVSLRKRGETWYSSPATPFAGDLRSPGRLLWIYFYFI